MRLYSTVCEHEQPTLLLQDTDVSHSNTVIRTRLLFTHIVTRARRFQVIYILYIHRTMLDTILLMTIIVVRLLSRSGFRCIFCVVIDVIVSPRFRCIISKRVRFNYNCSRDISRPTSDTSIPKCLQSILTITCIITDEDPNNPSVQLAFTSTSSPKKRERVLIKIYCNVSSIFYFSKYMHQIQTYLYIIL